MTANYKALPEFEGHEQVVELNDPASGLVGFIAIHNTALGPALGGTRIFPYQSKAAALKDVLRLSQTMTYKCAVAGLNFGGGKGAIIANPGQKNIKKILKAYAQEVGKLKGKFYTGEDVGLSEADVRYLLKFAPYFIGKPGQAADPSPYAALSAFFCIKVALLEKFGSDKIKNRSFCVKGVGKTGGELVKLLYKAGGKISICDVDKTKLKKLAKKFPKIKVVALSQIQKIPCDVYAPCAMGDDINEAVAKKIPAAIICGTANNQLSSARAGEILFKRGVTHVPDYVANAGGLIDVSAELLKGGYSKSKVLKSIANLKPVVQKILRQSRKTGRSPDAVGAKVAEQNFTKSGHHLRLALKSIKAIFQHA